MKKDTELIIREIRFYGVTILFLICFIIVAHVFVTKINCSESEKVTEQLKLKIKTDYVVLDNSNYYQNYNGEIISVLCDENILVNNYGDSIYLSTWDKTPKLKPEYRGSTGQCLIKYKGERLG